MKKQKLELDKRQTSLVQRKKFKMSELVAFKKIITFTYTVCQVKFVTFLRETSLSTRQS